jgi:hypothetical protein
VAWKCQVTTSSELGNFGKEKLVDGRIRNNWGWSSFQYDGIEVNEYIVLDWFFPIGLAEITIYAYTEDDMVKYFPVDFSIWWWNEEKRQWVLSSEIRNYNPQLKNTFSFQYTTQKVKITISKSSGNYVRIGEIQAYSRKIDVSDRLSDIFVNRRLQNFVETSTLRCSFENIDNIFNPENIQGIFQYPYLRIGRISLEVGIQNEYVPIFSGFLREPIRQEIEAYLEATDWWWKLEKISAEKVRNTSGWYLEKSIDFLVRELVIEGGIAEYDIEIDEQAQNIIISEADFSDMTIAEAISEIAEFSNFQAGFQANGRFYFRPRKEKVEYYIQNQQGGRKNLIGIKNAQLGWDDVYNIIHLSRKDIEDIEISSNISPRPNSFDRYGERILRIRNRFLEKASYLYSRERLQSILYQTEEARKTWVAQTILLPQLEVGDVIEVSSSESEYYPKGWDISQWDVDTWEDYPSLFIWETVGYIRGINYDFRNWTQEIDFQEV